MNKAGLLLVIVLLFCVTSLLNGCCRMPDCFEKDSRVGLTHSAAHQRICRSATLNMEMAWDDWDAFWMVERPSEENWLRTARY